MKQLIFDSYALIAKFEEEKGHQEVTNLLAGISKGESKGYMSVINLGEVYYITYREKGEDKAELALTSILQFP
ncbi:MAG: type II toxin-antitoxin system VapC family toxin, partial [Bacteroidetes bacterium]|nr:type II toxin-antitoxin system VapC family toxin [Bacteroidota bacterium]